MSFTEMVLAAGAGASAKQPWWAGIPITDFGPTWEAIELLMTFLLFVGTLVTVYYIQRWIGDY